MAAMIRGSGNGSWSPEALRIYLEALISGLNTQHAEYSATHEITHTRIQEHSDRQMRELVEQLRRESNIRDDATSAAIIKAEAATDHRFEAVNEFRAQLAAQAATFMGRREYDTAHADLVNRVQVNQERLATLEATAVGRSAQRNSTGQYYGWAVAGLSFLVSVIVMVNVFTGHP